MLLCIRIRLFKLCTSLVLQLKLWNHEVLGSCVLLRIDHHHHVLIAGNAVILAIYHTVGVIIETISLLASIITVVDTIIHHHHLRWRLHHHLLLWNTSMLTAIHATITLLTHNRHIVLISTIVRTAYAVYRSRMR